MADGTHIEWTDATWNIVTGCSVVSPGCTHCYAMKLAGTRLRHHPSRQGLTIDSKAGPVWNGQVRFNAEWLDQPLRWRRPRRIFVAAHGDLFHDGVSDDQLDQIFAVMALTPQHAYQVLTKRAERMRAYLLAFDAERLSRALRPIWKAGEPATRVDRFIALPLPNVWLGVSVEDQTRADARIPLLLETPAAVRWISAEPLLSPVNLDHVKFFDRETESGGREVGWESALNGKRFDPWGGGDVDGFPKLDWVVAGGESGPGARPMHPDWARQLRDQCAAAGVPFLFKQWGDWAPEDYDHGVSPDACHDPWGEPRWPGHAVGFDGAVASSADAAVQPFAFLRRCGKRAAGRLLDGALHDAFPTTSATPD